MGADNSLRALYTELGWTRSEIARRLDADEKTIRQMEDGLQRTPVEITAWLRALLTAHRAHPPPNNWRRRIQYPIALKGAA